METIDCMKGGGDTSSRNLKSTGQNFMALLTKSKESLLTEARNSALEASVFHRLAGNVCLSESVLKITKAFLAYTASA